MKIFVTVLQTYRLLEIYSVDKYFYSYYWIILLLLLSINNNNLF